jgi:hypothetical protein
MRTNPEKDAKKGLGLFAGIECFLLNKGKLKGVGLMNAILGAFTFIPIVALYVFFLVVVWRFMRAHESMAESIRRIAENMKKEP